MKLSGCKILQITLLGGEATVPTSARLNILCLKSIRLVLEGMLSWVSVAWINVGREPIFVAQPGPINMSYAHNGAYSLGHIDIAVRNMELKICTHITPTKAALFESTTWIHRDNCGQAHDKEDLRMVGTT